eukprot:TRINITY_DN1834_c2_g1_i1.p1 TRINITY_DN1834_c2_g1~~TRINITY_DN1834_c2_g1_i1.p1  ORF type:complete len:445 (-),score=79.57 TRINITY_DN1834_c2_g1_i1:1550-2884(-)
MDGAENDRQAKRLKVCTCRLLDLPDELLSGIFLDERGCGYLVSRAICKRVRDVVDQSIIAVDLKEKETTDCTYLQTYLPRVTSLKDFALQAETLRDEHLRGLSSVAANLRTFTVEVARSDLHEETMVNIVSQCSHLRTFWTPRCRGLQDRTCLALGTRCTNVRFLELAFCDISDVGVAYIANGCPQLEHITLMQCAVSDVGLQSLAAGCPHLRELELQTVNVSDVGLISIAQRCSELKQLEIFDTELPVTDATLEAIGLGCPNLVEFNLRPADRITDQGIAALTRAQQVARVLLSPDEFLLITDCALQHLAACGVRMQALHLVGAENITDIGLTAIAQSCVHLEELSVTASQASDDGVNALVPLSMLRHLNMGQCEELTDVSLRRLMGAFPSLTTLEIDDCPNITPRAVAALQSARPRVIVNYHRRSAADVRHATSTPLPAAAL